MYHYVRDVEGTQFPQIHARKLNEFEYQIEHLVSHYKIISLDRTSEHLELVDPSVAFLTFDDGLRDHFTNVFGNLKKNGIPATFFVSSAPLISPKVLDVHKIQLLLGSQKIDSLYEDLRNLVGNRVIKSYEESGAIQSDTQRFDESKVVLLKRLLQRDLDSDIRSEILEKIFSKYFYGEEAALSKNLYMSLDELKSMKLAGMNIGNHTHSHYWLGYLEEDAFVGEIELAEEILMSEGLMDENFKTIAYPYGNSNEVVRNYLSEKNYKFGFTTVPSIWEVNQSFLSIPRLDTNDVPFSS